MNKVSATLCSCLLGSSLALGFAPLSAEEQESTFILKTLFGGKVRNHLDEGHRLYREGQYRDAVNAYYKNAMENRGDEAAWYHLGLAYLKAHEYSFAAHAFQTAIQLDPRVEHRYHLALAQFQAGFKRTAVINLREVVALHPDHDMSWTLLGRSYEALDQMGQAKSCYLKALAISPHQGQANFLIERMAEIKVQPLYIAQQSEEHPPALAQLETGKATGPIPLSQVITSLPPQKLSQAHPDLSPIMNSYHLSTDAEVQGLQPTKAKTWQKPQMKLDLDQAPSPIGLSPEPVEITPPSLDISLEEL